MKSPMIMNASYIKEYDKNNFSDLQVIKSGTGYFIGTIYTDPETGFIDMGSRDSDYFKTRKEAEIELKLLEQGKSNIVLRTRP